MNCNISLTKMFALFHRQTRWGYQAFVSILLRTLWYYLSLGRHLPKFQYQIILLFFFFTTYLSCSLWPFSLASAAYDGFVSPVHPAVIHPEPATSLAFYRTSTEPSRLISLQQSHPPSIFTMYGTRKKNGKFTTEYDANPWKLQQWREVPIRP